ncbi:MAG: hypothetical protein F4183_03700 [Rhodothermaceae bacterium]|nr:hypothetical protein [Rhodothermaceae bacterium]
MTFTISAEHTLEIVASLIAIVSALIGIGIWIGHVNSDRQNLKTLMKRMEKKLDEILSLVRQRSNTVKDGSPLCLNDKGEKVWKDLDASEWIERFFDDTKNLVRDKDAYQIQQFTTEYVTSDKHYLEEELKLIREIAYENGLSDFDVRLVLGIKLRDKLLEK